MTRNQTHQGVFSTHSISVRSLKRVITFLWVSRKSLIVLHLSPCTWIILNRFADFGRQLKLTQPGGYNAGMPYSARRTQVAANWVVAALLPVSAIAVAATSDPLPGIAKFLLYTVLGDIVLCLVLAFACMLLGYGRAILKRAWFEPEPLIGFGAALGTVVFTAFGLLSHTSPDGPLGPQPPNE